MVQDIGDTGFVDHLQKLRSAVRGAADLRIVKGTGDGFLAVFTTASGALAAARALRDTLQDPAHVRLVVHWGLVRMSADDVIGSEVHRLFRIESVDDQDRVDGPATWSALPFAGRVALSRAALAALPADARAGFRRAGAFRLKGFDEPEVIWVETR
jgi:class 3 adenylate cyclase